MARNASTTPSNRTGRNARKASVKSKAAPAKPSRSTMVWVSFVAAMTLVGGMLVLIDGRPSPRTDGLVLSPLAATGPTTIAESITQTHTPLDTQRWQAIVIHHSGEMWGTASSIASEHEAIGFKGLGHHFIVGNGAGMDDGEVFVGFRWFKQQPGAHAAGENGEWLNLHSVSICLVGNGNRRPFTAGQMRSLETLVRALQRELDIPAERVYLHSDATPVADPGQLFPAAEFRATLSR